MPYQIALAWDEACEKELLKKGFVKREVYIHPTGVLTVKDGDQDFFRMHTPPFQFVTTSYWGAGPA